DRRRRDVVEPIACLDQRRLHDPRGRHELGHNFGDYHSRSSSCDTTGWTISEYGDDRDIMGATTAHLNAFQKERLGWLNYAISRVTSRPSRSALSAVAF